MLYSISKNYIKDVIDFVDAANKKINKYPSESVITYKFCGEYYVPCFSDTGKIVPLHMWKLDVDFGIKSRNYQYIGLLSVNSNGYYSLEKINGETIDCPFYM